MEVLTLTGNLLAEWTFAIGKMERGATHRADSMTFQVGGKGINVTRILELLGVESEALAFADGAMARYCGDWLADKGVRHRFFPLESAIRPGVVIREQEGADLPETTFLGKDARVPDNSWAAACQYAGGAACDWMAISGSIPGWQSSWKGTIEQFLESGTRLAVDTYGPALDDLARLPVDLIKINRNELASLVPCPPNAAFADAVRTAWDTLPVRNWIITDGAREIIAALEDGSLYSIIPAKIREVSAMGSGDTFLAALLSHWNGDADPIKALRFACSCATGNAASPGIGDFPIPPPEEYFPEIRKIQ